MDVFVMLIVVVIIAVPSFLLGHMIAVDKVDKRHRNIGVLYISVEDEKPLCYMALDDVEVLKTLREGEWVFMTVKRDD